MITSESTKQEIAQAGAAALNELFGSAPSDIALAASEPDAHPVTLEDLKTHNSYRYSQLYARDKDIAIDADLFNARMVAMSTQPGIRSGDWLRLKDGRMARVAHHWGDSVQPSYGNGDNGSFYLGDGYASYSGSLDPAIPVEQFRQADEARLGWVWLFHRNDSGGSRGVRAQCAFRVFEQI